MSLAKAQLRPERSLSFSLLRFFTCSSLPIGGHAPLVGVFTACTLLLREVVVTCRLLVCNKKPTVLERSLSVSRVFPVDDSAKVESFTVCCFSILTDAIEISVRCDLRHTVRSYSHSKQTNKKPTVLERSLSVSRVFPVDDSAKVESSKVCCFSSFQPAIKIILAGDLNHITSFSNLYAGFLETQCLLLYARKA